MTLNEIILSKKQINLFLKIMKHNNDITFKLDNVVIFVDNMNKEKIIDVISDYYIKNGIDKKFETSNLGEEIENLLDRFNRM